MSVWSFRPLLLFWAVVIGLLAVMAAVLQTLGPPRPPPIRQAAVARRAEPPARAFVPARVPPSTDRPAPALPMTAASIPDPYPALLEPGVALPDRLLPRVAGPGGTAARLYAAAFDPAERHPRVALVIDGAGLDRALTGEILASLPSAIDLAFSAYAPEATAAALARRARQQGRECLVSVPMEPTGYPEAEEGDRALLIGAAPAGNSLNLEWALSNVAGCVGATGGSDGLNGERFAQSREAFADLLATIDRRGLIYLDPRPGAAPPPGVPTPPRVVDVIVDRPPALGEAADAQAIDRALAELESDAARRGSAIGLAGPPRPVLLDRIAVWAHGLAGRGIVLAPLTAIPPPAPPQETPP